ncbi:MAG: DUF6362 family protein [Gemmobacter sp.]|jgi:hypothetical protein|nr:DUF6362 family protein [Gemmobacter sp.]
MITPSEIEDRFEEAALTLKRLPNPPGSGARGYGRSWPDYVHEARHAYGYEEARIRVIPNAREIQRMEETLEWLALIGGDSEQAIIDNRRIVWMRAEGYRWKQICRAVGCVRSTAWRRWTAALLTIANRLNKQGKNSARPRVAKSTGDGEAAKPGGGGTNGPP